MFKPLSVFGRTNDATPARSDPFAGDPFFRLQHEMNRLFENAVTGFGAGPLFRDDLAEARAPRIDVHETDSAVEVDAELPGVEEKDLDVRINDNLLTISGEKKFERKDEKDGAYRVTERSYGSFTRTMTLPFSVDPDSVEATFKNGVLKLTLPKPADARTEARRIAIKRG